MYVDIIVDKVVLSKSKLDSYRCSLVSKKPVMINCCVRLIN